MLLSLVLTIRPLGQPNQGKPLPRWWGRAVHALLLDTIVQIEPSLAERLHTDDGARPFTVSNLMGPLANDHFDLDSTYRLRFTALNEDVSNILIQSSLAGKFSSGSTIELDYLPFQVEAFQPQWDTNPAPGSPGMKFNTPASNTRWANASTYADLSAAYLIDRGPAPDTISMSFASPTSFKSGGKHIPIPLPELVFGSLLNRWNAFAPIAFPPETRGYASECMAISRYKLASRVVPVKGKGLRMGAVGEVTYRCLNDDRYWMSLINTLADFALYSGVGVGTTMGLGQVRRT